MIKAQPRISVRTEPVRIARSRLAGSTSVGTAALLAFALAGPAAAQEELLGLVGGLTATVDLSFGLVYDDDTGTTFESDVLIGLSSVTRNQAFTFNLGSGLDAGDGLRDGDAYEFARPTADLDYVFNNGASQLSFGVDYSSRDIDGTIDDPLSFDPTDLIEDDGTLATTNLAFGVAIGLDRSVGASFDYTLEDRTYADTADPALVDTETETFNLALRFTPSRTLNYNATAELIRDEEADAVNTLREISRFGLSADWRATPSLSVNASIGHATIDSTVDVGLMRVTTTVDGFEGALGLVRDMRNGSATADLSRELTVNGPLDRLTAGRAMELANGGSLGFSLGVASFDSGANRVIGNVTFSRPTRHGSLALSFDRNVSVDGDELDIQRTSASAAYTYEIDRISDVTFDMSYAAIDTITAGGSDTERTDFGITYTRELTGDWAFSAGLGYGESRSSTAADSTDREAFLTLERTFSFRP